MTTRHADSAPSTARIWSDEQLELYHDRELDRAASELLAADLRTDPALRDRLSAIGQLDRAIRRTVLTAPPERPRVRALRLGAMVATFLTLATGIMIAVLLLPVMSGTRPPMQPIAADIDHIDPPPPMESRLGEAGMPVLASFAVRRDGPPSRPVERAAQQDVAPATEPTDRSLADLLASGDVDTFLARTRSTTNEDRDAAFSLLGGTLRSAMTAQSVLDKLTPEEQLAVCAVWAREPRLRPVTFERLASLQNRPELKDRVNTLASELARSRDLLAWVRSYGLQTSPTHSHAG